MYIECIAILAVLLIIIVMAARGGRSAFALAITPLLLVPGAYLLSAPLAGLLAAVFPLGRPVAAIAITVLGLVASCVLFGLLCGNFGTRRMRRGYLLMCGGFSTILAVLLIFDIVTRMAGI